jgi:hypothetical protein
VKVYVARHRRLTVDEWLALGWEREDAERYARLDRTTAEVVVLDDAGIRPLRHFVRHSPTGFAWGYQGSGPAELARCILLDHFGITPSNDGWEADGLPVSYQAFKRDVIARQPQSEPWSITEEEIERWASQVWKP